MAAIAYSHGALGHWAAVDHGFHIGSILASAVVIIASVSACIKHPSLYWRPSFRLSAWIAVCTTVYSACQLCIYNSYMSSLSEVNLRVIHWLISASALSFSFLSACLGVHLVLLVLNSHTKLAQRIQPWYEAGSLFLGFAITHPILYLYEQVKWASDAQGFHISADPTHYKVSSWLTMWAWMTAACCFLAVISVLAFIKMSYVFPAHLRFSFLFASNEKGNSSDNAGASYVPTLSKERSREVFATSAWMLVFSFIPITTQVWVVAANMLTRCPTWLCVLANLIPATQGMLNLLVLAGNPALDDCQHWLASGYLRLYAKGGSTPKMGHMDVKAALTSRVLSTSTLAEK